MGSIFKRYWIPGVMLLLQMGGHTAQAQQAMAAEGPQPGWLSAGNYVSAEQKMIPLTELLSRWQSAFHIHFNYNFSSLSGKLVPEKDAKAGSAFSESQLEAVLRPLGLQFVKLSHTDYAIRPDAEKASGKTESSSLDAKDVRQNGQGQVKQAAVHGVVSNEKGEPLPGTTVTDKSSNKSVVADDKGYYSITATGTPAILHFKSIGYLPQEVKVGGRTEINIILKADAKDLSGVVVTALGIKRQEKALGYAISTLDGSKVNTVKEVSVINALSGKVAGVDIRSVSSDPAGSVLINIRGNSSFTGNDFPLFVVDGTPILTPKQMPVQASSTGAVVDYGNPVADINPDDIASISILKGASAAALYGSRSGAGVVLITTKSGSGLARKGLGMSFNSTAMFDRAWQFPEFQNDFGAGSRAGATDSINTTSSSSWGARLNTGAKYIQWNSPIDPATGKAIPTDWVAYPNRIKDFFLTGQTYTNNLALTGSNYRISYTNLQNKGIVPNTDLQRNTIGMTGNFAVNSRIKVNTNVTYTNNHSNNRPTFNRGSASHILYTLPANVDSRLLKNYWMPLKAGLQQFSQDGGKTDNPYFVANELTNGFTRNRIMGNVQLVIDLTKHWTLMGRTGLDWYAETEESKRAYSASNSPFGGYAISDQNRSEQNHDFLLTYKNEWKKDFQYSFSAGANRMDQKYHLTSQSTNSLVVPGLFTITNAAGGSIVPNSFLSSRRINSVYGMGNFSYRNYAFLDLTYRRDWTSTLPTQYNSYYYPSASLSLIVSDMLDLHSKILPYAKLRLNWSRVGKDTEPYQLYNSFNFLPDWGKVKMADFNTTLKNSNLKPEMADSYELGTDLKLFSGRLGLEATWYKAVFVNEIVAIPTVMSAGYNSRMTNVGKLENSGWELGLNGTPVAGAVRWDIGVNFTRNRNKVVRISPDITYYVLGSAEGVTYQIKEGAELGDMYGKTWTTVPDGKYKGQQLLSSAGTSQQATTLAKVGNYNADFRVGITNTVTWKNFTLNALIDWRQGGQFYSYVHMNLLSDGRTTNTLRGRDPQTGGLSWNDGTYDRTDGMIEDGYVPDGNGGYVKNTKVTDPENYYGDYYWKMIPRNTFSATYVKLRELSLTWQVGKRGLGNLPISNLNIAFIARNLFSWTAAAKGYDPETAMTISNGSITPGTTSWSLPYTRSYGVKLGFNF